MRLAHGIYLFPKIDEKLGLCMLYPSVEEIAKAIAERDKARIVPTGVYALNALGLPTQIPVNAVFLTDGAPRKIKIYNQRILFKHVVPIKFFKNFLKSSQLFKKLKFSYLFCPCPENLYWHPSVAGHCLTRHFYYSAGR